MSWKEGEKEAQLREQTVWAGGGAHSGTLIICCDFNINLKKMTIVGGTVVQCLVLLSHVKEVLILHFLVG